MSKYMKEIAPRVYIDVYDVLDLYNITCPAVQHAVMNLLEPIMMGGKSESTGLIDAYDAVGRAVVLSSNRMNRKAKAKKGDRACQTENASHVAMVDVID